MPSVSASIIVPVYNAEKYLNQCVDSLINQTAGDLEIILVDDGSPDLSEKICDSYAESYPDIVTVIHQSNAGVSAARNAGIKAARGKWLMFVDSDDWLEPDAAERLLGAAEAANADLCIAAGGYYMETKNRTALAEVYNGPAIDGNDTLTRVYLSGGGSVVFSTPTSKLYLRENIIENGICFVTGLRRCEDTVFNLYAYEHAQRPVVTGDAVYHIRAGYATVAGRYGLEAVADYSLYFEEMQKYAKKHPHGGLAQGRYRISCLNRLIELASAIIPKESCGLSFKEKRREILSLISREPFAETLKQAELKNMRLNRKITVGLLKLRQATLFYLMYKLWYLFKSSNSRSLL